jgi:hypothetical protein
VELKKVVLRFLDGHVLPGFAPMYEDGLETIFSADMSGIPFTVPLDELKAVFFVRTFSGNPDYDPKRTPEDLSELGGSNLVRVSFQDGEVLTGEVRPGADLAKGFFLTVIDPDDNNILIYVNPSGLKAPPEPAGP